MEPLGACLTTLHAQATAEKQTITSAWLVVEVHLEFVEMKLAVL
jgi:hypothetical protein